MGGRCTSDEDMSILCLSCQKLGASGNSHADPQALQYKDVGPIQEAWRIYYDPIEAATWFAVECEGEGSCLPHNHFEKTWSDNENNKTLLSPNRVEVCHPDGPFLRGRGCVAKCYMNHNT